MNTLNILLASQFQDYFSRFGYLGIFIWFITIDQIIPIPEEITLIAIGYLAMQGNISPVMAGLFAIAGFITVDLVYFYLTKTGNKLIYKLAKKQESPIEKKYKNKLKNHTFKTLLILCFIPRMRLLGPVFVALSKLPFKRFILYDVISLSLFTTIYISLGMIFSKSLSSLISVSNGIGNIIFIAALIVMSVLTFIIIKKLNKKQHT